MMQTTTQTRTAAVIPAYQPGLALLSSTRALIAAGFIVVVVDDGSGAGYRPLTVMLGMGAVPAKVITELSFFVISYLVQRHVIFAMRRGDLS